VVSILAVGYLLFFSKSDKDCQFVAAYEATKNPQDSAEKQANIYNGYLELCKDPSFNYDLWKIENNIPER
ncbi:MAG: hypothetical protein Q8L46_02205, partial [candidate division WWE3 bacterium]|nr:hypothetical protein [candidate division WWE3 bacterium]